MGHRIEVLENFVEADDALRIITMLDEAYVNGDLEAFPDNPRVGVLSNKNLESEKLIKKYSDKLVKIHQETFGLAVPLFTVQGHNSIWERGSEAGLHVDSHKGSEHIITSSVLYLGGEYTGGDIEFPQQAFSYQPKALSAVIFPSGGLEYPHRVNRIKTGTRYTMAMWHSHLKAFSLGQKYMDVGEIDLYNIWS